MFNIEITSDSSNEISKANNVRTISRTQQRNFARTWILPISDVINCRKLLFLHHILNLKEDDPLLKLYKEQNKLLFEKNWANEISRLREHYNIMLKDSEIQQMKKEKWRTLIKEKIVAKTFHELKDKLELKTKTKNLTYKSLRRQQYIYEIPATLARIIFKARLSMINVKMNYKSKYVNNWKCRLCGTEKESYSHLFTCKEYGEDIKEITEGLDGLDPNCIFGENTEDLNRVAQCISKVSEIREENLTRERQ